MTKNSLQSLGALLRESMTTTANFDALTKDLKKRLKKGEVNVHVKQIADNVFEYRFSSVVKEEAVETKPAADVWGENKDSSKTYVSNTVYFVKPVKGGEKYEVSTEEGTTRKPFATLSKVDLDKSFTMIRPKQTPDAEGYTQYRDSAEVEAFKNDADTFKIDDSGTVLLLTKGDYLVRKTDGENFTYEVKKAKDFEAHYAEK